MPSLLSLPRELRDLVYQEVFRGSTSLKASSHSRKSLVKRGPHCSTGSTFDFSTGSPVQTFWYPPPGATSSTASEDNTASATEPQWAEGEMTIRYPLAVPVPPTASLLESCRQLRTEMLDTIRHAPVHYKIRLAYREDKCLIYPTWISLPTLANHIDVLDVELRVREKKTPSLFSMASTLAEGDRYGGDELFGCMVLLRRFLERGVFFLGKKKKHKITVDRLVLRIEPKDFTCGNHREMLDDASRGLDDLFWDRTASLHTDLCRDNRGEFLQFFAARIRTFECRVGEHVRSWNLADVSEAARSEWDPEVVARLSDYRPPADDSDSSDSFL